ncbi:MAG: DUF371 domain-containing protein [Methanobrevibacter sp.]|nr:DUF371 domain-containing protein [Candidatus Methanoflexus mossambicus]
MKIEFTAHGHRFITSKHKSTFEITTEKDLTPAGDCIIGVSSDLNLNDFNNEFKSKITNDKTEIIVNLYTPNGFDTIKGFGDKNLTLSHPTDVVIRKSNFTCSRTLMIKANKAAIDLNPELINDLKNCENLNVEIILNDKE